MAQAKDWIGSFIEQEVRLVLSWKQTPKVKQDPDSRFHDDGSNFRSITLPSLLPQDSKVQISKVVSTEDPLTVLVTDGFTQVKALLSEDVVTSLEAELGEKMNQETRGDVFAIREATVISTSYGPSDGFIQLAIEEVEYLYHLRKSIGQPRPVEQRKEIAKLIDEISRLREQQYALAEKAGASSPDPLTGDATPGAIRRSNGNTPRSQKSTPRFRSSPPVIISQSPRTQRAIATQVPTRRKPNSPSLSTDGFEIASGVNLDRPTGTRHGTSTIRPSFASREQPPANGGTSAKLLSLLGKRKAEVLSPRPEPEPQVTNASQHRSAPPTPEAQPHPCANVQPGANEEPQVGTAPPSAQPIPQRRISSQQTPKDYGRRRIPRDQQKLLDRPSSWLPSLPGQQFPHPNVPIELLKRWNAQAPRNSQPEVGPEATAAGAGVPAEKIAAEEVPMETSSDSSSDGESSLDEEIPWSQSPSQRKPLRPPDSTMDNNSQPPPVQKGPELFPPDSSNEHNAMYPWWRDRHTASRPGSAMSTQRTPHTLPKRGDWNVHTGIIRSPAVQSPSQRGFGRSHGSLRGETSRPSTAQSQLQGSPTGSSNASRRVPTPSWRRQQGSQLDGAQSLNPSPLQDGQQERPVDRSSESKTREPPPRNVWIPKHLSSPRPDLEVPASTFSTVVKGTQLSEPGKGDDSAKAPDENPAQIADSPLSKRGSGPNQNPQTSVTKVSKGSRGDKDKDEDDMEMDVPRSLDRDPTVAHRQRRTQHFRTVQRRDW